MITKIICPILFFLEIRYYYYEKNFHWNIFSCLFFGNLGTSIACEFLKEQIGVVVPNIIEKYDLLDDPTNDDSGSTTYLKNMIALVFVMILN